MLDVTSHDSHSKLTVFVNNGKRGRGKNWETLTLSNITLSKNGFVENHKDDHKIIRQPLCQKYL